MDDRSLAEWLHARERADWRARSKALTRQLISMVAPVEPVHVLDLASGTGSNVRYLIEHLPRRQRWLAVDRSPLLLQELAVRTSVWAKAKGHSVTADETGLTLSGGGLDCRIETRVQDLGCLDDASLFAGRHLVTASALLDLVSAEWLRVLALQCRDVGAAALFPIVYDGRSSCTPAEPEDELVRDLLNRHQGRDKGLGGPAEGPGAAERAKSCFSAEGYEVQSTGSDWVLSPDDLTLQRLLIDGWATAAVEMAPELTATIAAWRARRLAHLAAGRSHIVVGHRDVAAWRA